MGSILPVLLAVVFAGLIAQGMQLAQALPGGSSQSGQSQNAAAAAAVQAELFGAACINAALASPAISSSISVTMPAGVPVPAQALCETVADPVAGRDVYSYTPGVPGEATSIESDTEGNASWFRSIASGQAASLSSEEILQIPATIPVGVMLEVVQVNP
ncbi:hypothetical protein LMG22037_05549 [Paraburkholderia phenoliruptrix]|jgi:hypothetical protein|uniref:Uncharacterized protein n=1 Tax=Paraburkholderia phenoliruptrix TaxID=252970 RepID=A0A6J5CBK8_9BURK|nr:hypothetical protein [Paraburkholderia phenoliruptrix]CAB3730612.1 hypothetical protein LMG22037_05549 [Paraburkholderia phenoliruptrix]